MSGFEKKAQPEAPKPEEIVALKKRLRLTYEEMAEPLYGVTARRLSDCARGLHRLDPIIWWALRLHFDGVDLRERRESVGERGRVIGGFQE